ncbi:helix-turn-helix domain-containing protein [Actinosynnema sp. NPDC020468]|uniref:TetR/AcrR family transcriptional regulator n=1 Tax=Actinosynnema sp. NPDC020468 TaxID=3154488 RepID=UPI0033D8DC21
MTGRLPHNLRSDARDNRERILEAARAVFLADGLDAPIREVARRAEVGQATVHRHFPTKRALVAEAFADRVRECRSIVDEGLADPDAWRGFRHVVAGLFESWARDGGFTSAVRSAFPDAVDFAGLRASSLTAVAELVRRAKATGHLRPDVVVDDLVLMIMANSGIRAGTPAARVAASRRFAALVIEAFRTPATPVPLPPVPRLTPASTLPV